MEKCTEIGIDEITPLLCDHSERKVIKEDTAGKSDYFRHETILESLFTTQPHDRIFPFCKKQSISLKCIAHCDKGTKKSLQEIYHPRPRRHDPHRPRGRFREMKSR
ncbi:MAG: hypothetical protein V8R91_02120 [Butyricimonas faecihominis]